jgi:hypothetical protein
VPIDKTHVQYLFDPEEMSCVDSAPKVTLVDNTAEFLTVEDFYKPKESM